MNNILRLEQAEIEKRLFDKGKICIIYGPRQVGKTTLSKTILKKYESSDGYFNCEEVLVQDILLSMNSSTMYNFFSSFRVIVLDEAQTVENIGRSLKILIDAHPELNIIATGSSSFDLANKVNEPLTGRHYEFFLPPLSHQEILHNYNLPFLMRRLSDNLIYGSYPEVFFTDNYALKTERLKLLASSYLYRDILSYTSIKNSSVLNKILKGLALQVGSLVSPNEISNAIGIDRKTVVSYITLLEQAFIIFPLHSFAKNKRNEIKKQNKYYFYDNGILNALSNNLSPTLDNKNIGALWENLLMAERLKLNMYNKAVYSGYFWRTHSKQEVDYIEEYDNQLHPYEFKYSEDARISKGSLSFIESYNTKLIKKISKNNFYEFTTDIKDNTQY